MSRPCFEPTDEQRRLVQAGLAAGLDQETIAAGIGISKPTLAKYFAAEIGAGGAAAKLAIASTLYNMATSGACPAATIFMAKTRLRMSEKEDFAMGLFNLPVDGRW